MLIISVKVSCEISTNILKINTLIGSLYPIQILSLFHLFVGLKGTPCENKHVHFLDFIIGFKRSETSGGFLCPPRL